MADQELYKEAVELQARAEFQMRSCAECNPAHEHLNAADGPLFVCTGCSRWFYRGRDLTAMEHTDV